MSNNVLTPETISNWNPARYLTIDNDAAIRTSDETLNWYKRLLNDHGSNLDGQASTAQSAVADYREAIADLDAIYKLHKNDDGALDISERIDLLSMSQRAGVSLQTMLATADRLERPSKSSTTSVKGADTAPREATFEGSYTSVAVDALDAVASGATTLDIGAKGAAIAEAQALLLGHGADLEGYGADGMFGPVTRRELVAFQEAHDLKATGSLDADTLTALRAPKTSTMRASANSSEVAQGTSRSERDRIEARLDELGRANPRLARSIRRQLAEIDQRGSSERISDERKSLSKDREAIEARLRTVPTGGRNARHLRKELEKIDQRLAELDSKADKKKAPVRLYSV